MRKNDVENNKVSANMGIIYNGMDLVNLDLYYGDDTVMAAVPELSQKFLLWILEKDWKNG